MATSPFKKVDVINGPFDPGGQPETRIGQPLELVYPSDAKAGAY